MPDYGHEPAFGVSIDPTVQDLDVAFALARRADDLGLNLLAVQDHAYQPSHLDTWTLLTYLSAATRRITVMPDVADLQLRPPAVLAKAASTLSILNGGRVQLGVGGGPFPDAIAGMGMPRREAASMVAYSDAAVGILRSALRGGHVQAGNDEHRVSYDAGPAAARPPQVWLGAQKPRMLRLAGRKAEGWISPLNIYVPPADVPEKQRTIDEAARSAGRNPADIRRIYNVIGAITTGGTSPTHDVRQGLIGDTEAWVDFLTDSVTTLGFDTFVFWPTGSVQQQAEVFATEVVPAARASIVRERSTR
jgi:alkanesulfonate monooxygenase SsuD/methylene tetrahydromethanopterin reductase-like flavin-dependent oxidoreductase (luciferase family)